MVERLTGDMPAGSYAVGQHVRDPSRGIDRPVHAVRRTAAGELLQFVPGGPWVAAPVKPRDEEPPSRPL